MPPVNFAEDQNVNTNIQRKKILRKEIDSRVETAGLDMVSKYLMNIFNK